MWRVYSSQKTSMSAGSINRVLQAFEDGRFENVAAHGALVAAGALVACVRTTDATRFR